MAALVVGCGETDGESRVVAPGFERVVSAWEASPDLHDPGKPAGLGAIDFAERALGRPIPGDLIALLRYADGGSFLENNLGIYPVDRLLGA